MKTVYFRLLGQIRSSGFDVFRRDYSLSTWAKLWIALRVYAKARFA